MRLFLELYLRNKKARYRSGLFILSVTLICVYHIIVTLRRPQRNALRRSLPI